MTSLLAAVGLSLGAAIALGIARFAYALLLPPMKLDLGWSFAQAGSMNTGNALGYLIGALAFPWLSRRSSAYGAFLAGCVSTTILVATAGAMSDSTVLLAQRVASGVSSALIFVGGGVLASRQASRHPQDAGLILGIYYGGTGWGIALAAWLVPVTLGTGLHGWQPSWLALAAACGVLSIVAIRAARTADLDAPAHGAAASATAGDARPSWWRMRFALIGYAMFGVGYIGYMTFVIALLRDAGLSAFIVTVFYLLLGACVVVSAAPWARLLTRCKDGRALALLNGLVGIATLIPALSTAPAFAFVSGALFGLTFLSVVASTTAFVRHNFPPSQWPAGISAFTIMFAFGQIVGPVVIGWVSDGAGLARGFLYSALLLLLGAGLAVLQRPLRADA
ncbi:MFS transporter [Pandoraea terrae]|uniref:MFS transporter n=1 Tax=Pandoraea terrae TaxID=1537710 RepID=A0A5E4ZCQ1_9BURK|nr:MFS transporter [Pandoraea terrae]